MSLSARLKHGSAREHAAIEAFLAFDADAWPLERYQRYLVCMHAFHRAVEGAIDGHAPSGLGLEDRRKTPWLAEDLAHFDLAPLAAAPALSPLHDAARAIGWAYVLEGATLGGRVLFKPVARRWSLGPHHGATYLFGYGERTGALWREFTHALDAMPLREDEVQAAVAGACEAFSRLREWFAQNAWPEA
jgi:heme oxygenase